MCKFFSLLFTFVFFVALSSSAATISVENYLRARIPLQDKRYQSMKLALELMDERQPSIVLETGTSRFGNAGFIGDGGSSIIFGSWSMNNKKVFYSVDICQSSIETAKSSLGAKSKDIHFICDDSVSFLKHFKNPIDFLYLDSFDYEIENPEPSQQHHLKEIIAAYPNLKPESVIMIDDCDLPGGGKGGLVIPYLLERGWVKLYEGYQVIMIYPLAEL